MRKITMWLSGLLFIGFTAGCQVTATTDPVDEGVTTFVDTGVSSITVGMADITLVNQTGYSISSFYIAESTATSWGTAQNLGSVADTSSLTIIDITPCDTYYDLKVVDSTGYIAINYDLYVACDADYDFTVTTTVAP